MIEGHSLKLLPATEIFLIKIHKSQAKQFLEVDFKLKYSKPLPLYKKTVFVV